MRIMRAGWIGMLLVGLSFFSIVLAEEPASAPGVQTRGDRPDVDFGVKVNSGNKGGLLARIAKGTGEKEHVVNDSDKTIDLALNGETLVVNGSDNTITCQGKSAELSINGSGNTVRFNGTCDTLILIGSDNRAEIERVGSISVLGSGNRVTWDFASRGERPDIVSTGQDNLITKIK